MTEAEALEKSEHGERGGAEGLAGTFHEKVISFDTMELRLLLPTAVAIAVVIASAVLLGMRDFAWPLVSAGTVTGSVLGTVPLPIAVLTGVTLILAWSFVLAGALHAHLAFRILGVGSYTVVGLTSAGEADAIFESLTIVLIVLSVVVAAIGLYITDRGNHRQAPQLHHRVRLRLPTFGWILLATTLIYVMVALRGVRNGYFAEFIQLQLSALQFVLIPVLLLAGTDFTEWPEVLSGRISSLLERLPRAALVVAVAAAAGAALFWAYVIVGGRPGFSLSGTVRNLAPVVILAVPVCAVGGLGLTRKPSTQVPFWALARPGNGSPATQARARCPGGRRPGAG